MKKYTLLSNDYCSDEAYYEIKENNVIIMSSTVKPTELVIFIKGKRPKVIFKDDSHQITGISLVINGKHYKVNEDNYKKFKLSDDLKESGYLIDLNDYIFEEGLYSIVLSYPKRNIQKSLGFIAYIKDFDYEFKDLAGIKTTSLYNSDGSYFYQPKDKFYKKDAVFYERQYDYNKDNVINNDDR